MTLIYALNNRRGFFKELKKAVSFVLLLKRGVGDVEGDRASFIKAAP